MPVTILNLPLGRMGDFVTCMRRTVKPLAANCLPIREPYFSSLNSTMVWVENLVPCFGIIYFFCFTFQPFARAPKCVFESVHILPGNVHPYTDSYPWHQPLQVQIRFPRMDPAQHLLAER